MTNSVSLTSRVMDPVKALGRAGLLGKSLLNRFDGGVEILDDLDDHWTARHHKEERNWFIQELQDLAAEKSIRVTILGYVSSSRFCVKLTLSAVTSTSVRLDNFIPIPNMAFLKIAITVTCLTSYLPLSSIRHLPTHSPIS